MLALAACMLAGDPEVSLCMLEANISKICKAFTCGEDVHRRLANMFDQARGTVAGEWEVVR